MALVKYGGGVLEVRGSIGGQTFSRNTYGNYIRSRTKPVNPQSTRQSEVRAILSQLMQSWANTLTETQRAAWNVYANNVPRLNKLGEAIKLTGINHYLRSNAPVLLAGLTRVDDAPTTFTLPGEDPLFDITADATAQEIDVTFDDTRDWLDEDGGFMQVAVGAPQNASVNFFDGPWRIAGTIEGDSVAAPTSPATISVPYPIAADQKIFVKARIGRADGRLSDFFRETTIATAP